MGARESGFAQGVVVLTALNLEYKAMRAHLMDVQRIAHQRGGTGFEVGVLPGARLPVALVRTGQGNASAGVIAERAIEAFEPAAVMFVGVAGGLKDDVELGDVVVATRVYAVHGAKEQDGRSLARPRAFEADHELLDLAQHLDAAGMWESGGAAGVSIRLHFEPVASGEVVLNSRDTPLARQLYEHFNDAAAVEMESAGVAQAAHLNRGLAMLTVRGISDKADGRKHAADAAGGQPQAAARAALVAVAVLREFAAGRPSDNGPPDESLAEGRSGTGTASAIRSRSSHGLEAFGPLSPVAEVAAAAGPVGIPGRVPLFVGRAHELAELERALSAGPVVVQAVHGLGGIGKSALAARYALMHASEYSQVVWISAEDLAGIDAGLARFALSLEPQLGGSLPVEALAARATGWLAAHSGWLMILDNVVSASDLDALLAATGTEQGRVLVTSRTAVGWSRIGATAVRLDVLAPDEALVLLAATAGTAPERLDGGAQLCERLGFLPLALVQAGAYMAQNPGARGPDVREYLRLLDRYPAEMYSLGDVDTDPERTVARVWRVTLDRLADTPLAGQVLRVLAWFAPDAIPLDLLDGLAAQPALGRAVNQLAAYNMVVRQRSEPDDPAPDALLSVHRLVQAVTRAPDAADPHRTPEAVDQARDQAATLLRIGLPGDPEDLGTWQRYQRLMPHVDALSEHGTPETDSRDTLQALNDAGRFALRRGSVEQAIRYLARAYRGSLRLLPADHPNVLVYGNNLALAHEQAGDLYRAIPLLEHIYAERCRILGEDHPDTLGVLANLAGIHQAAGDLDRTIPLQERILEARIRELGEDHPDTFVARAELASGLASAGDLERSIALHERNVADRRRVLGEEHPDTLVSQGNLASVLKTAGQLGRALPLYQQSLDDLRRVFGEDDPVTLTARNNLALAYRATGDLTRAISLLERNLADRTRVLGEDHPDTLTSRGNLASAYRAAGEHDRAIPLHEHNLDDRLRELGEDHPDTLAARNSLASAYKAAGDLSRAITLYEHALEEYHRVLGADHPATLTVCNNLASVYRAAGEPSRAIPLFERTLADRIRILGEDHPATLTTGANLASALRAAGELDRAVPLYEKTFRACRRVLGADHRLTRTVGTNLAAVRGEGDLHADQTGSA